MKFFKKAFKFIYPYQHLHTKWWHRLLIVVTILSSLGLGVAVFVSYEYYPFQLSEDVAVVKVEGESGFDYREACREGRSLTRYSSWGGCGHVDIFNYLIDTQWAKEEKVGKDGQTYEEIVLLREYWTTSDKETVVAGLIRSDWIHVVYEEPSFILEHLLILILISLFSAVVSWSVFFGGIYRVILYVVYGKGLGKK